jgi:hypothetical protein
MFQIKNKIQNLFPNLNFFWSLTLFADKNSIHTVEFFYELTFFIPRFCGPYSHPFE